MLYPPQLAKASLVLTIGIFGQHAIAAPATPTPKPNKIAVIAAAPTPAPAPPVTQRFGENPKAYAKFGVKGHPGEDIGFTCGVPQPSDLTGEVVFTGSDPGGYGNMVTLLGYGGERVTYGHFQAVTVSVGQIVSKGQQLGLTGATGNADGCHKHLEVHPAHENRNNGYLGAIDPEKWKPVECGLTGAPAIYGGVICGASAKYDIKAATVAAIIYYENRGWPSTAKNVCSPMGACGIAQFTAPTWEAYGVDGDGDGKADRADWVDSIYSAANYLAQIAAKKPDPALVAAEYNCGPKCGGPRSEWPAETIDYVDHVVALRSQFSE